MVPEVEFAEAESVAAPTVKTRPTRTGRSKSTALAVAKPKTEIAPQGETEALLNTLTRLATDPKMPIERVERVFEFLTRVRADQARVAYLEAMHAAQGEMEFVRKDAYNKHTKSNYATFEALDRAIRHIYVKHGFAPTYRTDASSQPEHVLVILRMSHIGGHEVDYPVDMPVDAKGAKGGDVMTPTHAFGSAFSYGKRYALGGAFNVTTTDKDDDGNFAGGIAPALITTDQAIKIEGLLKRKGSDKSVFLRIARVASLDQIHAKDYGGFLKMLEAKPDKNRGEQ